MALTQRSIGKSRHRMVLLALTAITFVSLDLSSFGPVGTAQRLVRDVLAPVADVAGAIVSPFSNAWNAIFDYDDLEADRDAWKARFEEAEGAALAAEAEREAFRRLLEATDIDYIEDVPREAATVIRGAVGNFDADVITIDKGANAGIEPGMAVVTRAGLVGRIAAVDGATATVQLLSDGDLAVGVRLTSTDEVGIGSTTDEESTLFRIAQGLDWPDEDDARPLPTIGSVVVTAATSRYPAEIPLGRIEAVYPDPNDALTMWVDVRLANDVSDLGFVSVLLTRGIDEIPLDPTPSTTVPQRADAEQTTDPADETTADDAAEDGP
ncbi:MAG: rod shape-determining protein MreC [Actinomycetota bacterium]